MQPPSRAVSCGFVTGVPTDSTFASAARYFEQNPAKRIHEAVEAVYAQLAAH